MVTSGYKDQLTEVIGWLHYDTEKVAKFVKVSLSDGTELTLTPDHLVFISKQGGKNSISVFADRLEESQVLECGRTVVRVGRDLTLRGVYAPLTSSGRIQVNGVQCSCYAVLESHRVAHAVFSPWRALYSARRWMGVSKLSSWASSDPVSTYANMVYNLAIHFIPHSLLL